MPEWVYSILAPLVISVVIPSVIALVTVKMQLKAAAEAEQRQIEADEAMKGADVSAKQQGVYQGLYNALNKEIERLKKSHAQELSEIRKDYEEKIANLEKVVAQQGAELNTYRREIESLRVVISQTYSDEIRARDAAIRILQGEVVELQKEAKKEK